MTEHRNVLEPGVLTRLGSSMDQIAIAWQADITAVHRLEGELAIMRRERDAAVDRAEFVEKDLRDARERNEALVQRTAHLEAQLQAVYDRSEDAKDALGKLSSHTVDAARTAPPLPEKQTASDDLEGGMQEIVGEQVRPAQPEERLPAFLDKAPLHPGMPANEFTHVAPRWAAGARQVNR